MEQIIGQKKAQKIINTAISAAKKKKQPLPHLLFTGASGLGKTTLANYCSVMSGQSFKAVNAANIKDPCSILTMIEKGDPGSIFFLDEVHALKRDTVETLYTAMEEWYFSANIGGEIHTERLEKFTIIGATTENIIKPFKNRFVYRIMMEEYTDEEIGQMLELRGASPTVASALALYGRKNPRVAKNRLEVINDYFIANGITNPTKEDVVKGMAESNVNQYGFEPLEVNYMDLLSKQHGRSMGARDIMSQLSLDRKDLLEVETYLISRGYVAKRSGTGRFLKRKDYK